MASISVMVNVSGGSWRLFVNQAHIIIERTGRKNSYSESCLDEIFKSC